MAKNLFYPYEIENLIDTATAQLVREELTLVAGTDNESDCPLRNRLAGIFDLGDKVKAMLAEKGDAE